MAKPKKNLPEIEPGETKLEISEASLKDGFCNYKYSIINGNQRGFIHKVDGNGLFKESLQDAFAKLNVHLAVVDDVFKHSGIEIDDVDTLHVDELTLLFTVTGFKIKGGEENESIILIGNKYLSGGSRMELESPKIAMDSLSSYKWYNELKTAADKAREEVLLYHNGNYDLPKGLDDDDVKPDSKQLKISDGSEKGETKIDDDFDSAKQ